ncbi:Dehydrogenase/reductase SDR family member 12 [Thelohanellus kitauei]|uniref:Dehydrogenase/reductase SDR family member 12 n=1 Tax=Thelohanellus kitauei TaxID=669202 RepID=A0A0C2NBG6_THEKT|nr:Dehydrogenase/reductase SDR family member 12 [Thelohanellus kitauei]
MSYYVKSLIWYWRGCSDFVKTGYEKASKNFKSLESVDVDGWSFMVTGGSSGIGRSVVQSLLERKGTNVHIVCKDAERGAEALEYFKSKAHPTSNAFLHLVDLSEPTKVRDFAKEFLKSGKKLNVLINNAGILLNKLDMTSCNHERSFSLNVLGTYILTMLLIPRLEDSGENNHKPRVITVSSGGMLTENLNFDHPAKFQPFNGVSSYAQHKRQQVVLTDILAEKFPKIQFSTMHPGWVDTPGVKTSLPGFYKHMKSDLRTPEQGADTIMWLAISEEALSYTSGSFFFDRQKAKKFVISAEERYSKEIEDKYMAHIEKILSDIPIKFE